MLERMENQIPPRRGLADGLRRSVGYQLDDLRAGALAAAPLYPVAAIAQPGWWPVLFGMVALTHALNFGGTFWDAERRVDERVIYARAALSYALAPWLLLLIPSATSRTGLTTIFPLVLAALFTSYFVALARFDRRSVTWCRRYLIGAAGVWSAIGFASLGLLALIAGRAIDVPAEAKTGAGFAAPLAMTVAFVAAQAFLKFSRSTADHRLTPPGVDPDDATPGWMVALRHGAAPPAPPAP